MGSGRDVFLLCFQPKNVGKKLKLDLELKEHPSSVWKLGISRVVFHQEA